MQIVSSSVDAVRLFRSGATVTRKAVVEAAPGALRVCFVGLPLALEDSSVRLEAAGEASFVDQRVSVALAHPLGSGTSDEQELLAARAEEDAARADLAACAKHQETLQKVPLVRRVREADAPTPPASARARQGVLALRDELLAALHAERERLEREVDRLAKRRAALVDAVARAAGAAPLDPFALRKTVIATLRAPTQGEVEVRVSYFVEGARWAPSYVLRLDEGLTRARLELRASVCQSSGEDWSGTTIALSTAEATRFHELPELKSLRIGRAQRARPTQLRPLELDGKALFADYARAFPPPPPRQAPPPPPKPSSVGELEDSEITGVGMAPPGFGLGMAPSMPGGMAPVPTFSAPASIARRAMSAMSAPAPAMFQPQAKARASAPSRGSGGVMDDLLSAGPEAPALAEEPEPVVELDARMFDLESLRLPPPEEQAGKLRRVARGELYLDHATELGAGLSSPVALSHALDGWLVQSRRALATDPPDQHVLPAPDSGYFDVFAGEFRVDVPADGAFHSIPIAQGELPVVTRFVTVPREQPDVFRIATLQNPLASPLLRGPCDVYIGPEFLLTTAVDGVPPGGTLRVGLGVEQRIKVARNTRFSEATQGLMGGTNALKHHVAIELLSHLPEAIEIEVRERVPSATERDEDIKVEVVATTPAWRPWEPPPGEPQVRGAYAWTARVAPNGRADLSAEYVIRIPSKLELVGGNRRD